MRVFCARAFRARGLFVCCASHLRRVFFLLFPDIGCRFAIRTAGRDHLITGSRGHVFYIRYGCLCPLRRIECGMLFPRHKCRVRSWALRGAWWTFVFYRAISPCGKGLHRKRHVVGRDACMLL